MHGIIPSLRRACSAGLTGTGSTDEAAQKLLTSAPLLHSASKPNPLKVGPEPPRSKRSAEPGDQADRKASLQAIELLIDDRVKQESEAYEKRRATAAAAQKAASDRFNREYSHQYEYIKPLVKRVEEMEKAQKLAQMPKEPFLASFQSLKVDAQNETGEWRYNFTVATLFPVLQLVLLPLAFINCQQEGWYPKNRLLDDTRKAYTLPEEFERDLTRAKQAHRDALNRYNDLKASGELYKKQGLFW